MFSKTSAPSTIFKILSRNRLKRTGTGDRVTSKLAAFFAYHSIFVFPSSIGRRKLIRQKFSSQSPARERESRDHRRIAFLSTPVPSSTLIPKSKDKRSYYFYDFSERDTYTVTVSLTPWEFPLARFLYNLSEETPILLHFRPTITGSLFFFSFVFVSAANADAYFSLR